MSKSFLLLDGIAAGLYDDIVLLIDYVLPSMASSCTVLRSSSRSPPCSWDLGL